MPDSPATSTTSVLPTHADHPSVSSPSGSLHVVTTASHLNGGDRHHGAHAALGNGYQPTSPSQPLLSPGLLPGSQLPPTCGARQLSKLKRFLTTLQQFGSDISPEIGDRVRGLIVNLVNNAITVEEFHQQLRDATNFPLRPFVIPFLKTNLPLLHQELLQCSSHLSKRSPHSYPGQPSDLASAQMPGHGIGGALSQQERELIMLEAENELFDRSGSGEKRKYSDERQPQNDHHSHESSMGASPNKRKCTPPFSANGAAFAERLMEGIKQDSDDWRNIDTMLQCVMTIVEKSKRAIAAVRERSMRERDEMGAWARAMAIDAEAEVKRRAAEMAAKTDERVTDVKRRAEEAVNDVKRQAVVELQKAVRSAEEKANEALAQAHARMENAVEEARKQAADDVSVIGSKQEASKERCWNCGRKANETCSGCNVARYCGAFCQHKDWEIHHKDCGKQGKQLSAEVVTAQPLSADRATVATMNELTTTEPPASPIDWSAASGVSHPSIAATESNNSPLHNLSPRSSGSSGSPTQPAADVVSSVATDTTVTASLNSPVVTNGPSQVSPTT